MRILKSRYNKRIKFGCLRNGQNSIFPPWNLAKLKKLQLFTLLIHQLHNWWLRKLIKNQILTLINAFFFLKHPFFSWNSFHSFFFPYQFKKKKKCHEWIHYGWHFDFSWDIHETKDFKTNSILVTNMGKRKYAL